MSDRTYWVLVTREGGAWLADVPELAGAHTFAPNIPGLDRPVREVIAMVQDLPEGAENHLNLSYKLLRGSGRPPRGVAGGPRPPDNGDPIGDYD